MLQEIRQEWSVEAIKANSAIVILQDFKVTTLNKMSNNINNKIP